MLFLYTSTFHFPLFNSLSHFYSKKKFSLMIVLLPYLFIYLSPLELPDLFIFSINYLTFSSISFSPSSLELSNLFISPINCTSNFLFKSCGEMYFFSLPVVHMVVLLFEFQRYIISLLVSLFIFCFCIHLEALSCMSLWIKLYRAIVMFVVQFENITCHWEFSVYRAGLQLVYYKLIVETFRFFFAFLKSSHDRIIAPIKYHLIILSLPLSLSLTPWIQWVKCNAN